MGEGGWGQRGIDGEGDGGSVFAGGARCGVSFYAGSQVAPVFARPRALGFRIESGKTGLGGDRLTGVFSEEDLQLSQLPGNRTG